MADGCGEPGCDGTTNCRGSLFQQSMRGVAAQDEADNEMAAAIDEEFRIEAQWEDDQRNVQWDDG